MLANTYRKLTDLTNGKSTLCMWIFCALVSGLFVPIIIAFKPVSAGNMPVDTIYPLTTATLFEQLPSYTAESLRLYSYFLGVDFIFPLTLSLSFTMLWIWQAKYWRSNSSKFFLNSGLPLLPLISALLDWMENLMFILVIYSLTSFPQPVAELACVIRWAKLCVISSYIFATPLIAIWLYRNKKR